MATLYFNEVEQRILADLVAYQLQHLEEHAQELLHMRPHDEVQQKIRREALLQRTDQILALRHIITKLRRGLPPTATVTGTWEELEGKVRTLPKHARR